MESEGQYLGWNNPSMIYQLDQRHPPLSSKESKADTAADCTKYMLPNLSETFIDALITIYNIDLLISYGLYSDNFS